jgi:hypothetical protein
MAMEYHFLIIDRTSPLKDVFLACSLLNMPHFYIKRTLHYLVLTTTGKTGKLL